MALNMEGATFCMFTVIWGEASANSAHTYEGLHASWAQGLAFIGGESDSLKGPLSTSNSGNWAGSVKKARGRLGSHDAPWIHFPKLPPQWAVARGLFLIVEIKGAPCDFLAEFILSGWQISDYKCYSVEFTGKSVSCIAEFSLCERLWACWLFSIFRFQKVEEARKHNPNAMPTAKEGWVGN